MESRQARRSVIHQCTFASELDRAGLRDLDVYKTLGAGLRLLTNLWLAMSDIGYSTIRAFILMRFELTPF